jgi:oxygen-dependent protoporphyrinogen oxidase
MKPRDVLILGAGLAGLSAAFHLRDLDLEVIEAADHVGGRTKSVRLPNEPWNNYGAQYITEDRPHVVDLADAVGGARSKRLVRSSGPSRRRLMRSRARSSCPRPGSSSRTPGDSRRWPPGVGCPPCMSSGHMSRPAG